MSGFIHGNIEIYTHFFAVLPKSPQMNPVIFSFLNNFIEPEWKYNPVTRQQEKVVGKIWAGKTTISHNTDFPLVFFRLSIPIVPVTTLTRMTSLLRLLSCMNLLKLVSH